MATVDDIQSRIAGMVDQDSTVANIDSTDYVSRLNLINRRERSWAETGKWQCLVKEYNTRTSTSSGNCSISLPSDFRSIAILPQITYDGTNSESFQIIRPQDEDLFDPITSHYVKMMGNSNSGYTMVVNSPTSGRQLISGASIKIPYYSTPASLASPSDVVTCPNPEYIVQGVIADVWESKEDARFQGAKVEANTILQNMIEFENTPTEQAYNSSVKSPEQRSGYRWGQ